MREFKYGVGVIAPNFLLNLLLVKMSEKSLTKADFWSKNPKDMSHDGTWKVYELGIVHQIWAKIFQLEFSQALKLKRTLTKLHGV